MHDTHGTEGEPQVSGRHSKQLRKAGAKSNAPAPSKRARPSSYTGRLSAAKVPAKRRDWSGKRKRRPSWDQVKLVQLDEACEFSSDREISDPVTVVRELKRHPQYLEPMREATRHLYEKKPSIEQGVKLGRHRMRGDWLLLFLGFVMSGDTSRLSFWNRYASSPIWEECGFDGSPDYEILRLRFNELEQYWQGLRGMGRLVIRQAVRHDPELADFWMSDSTGWNSPSLLEHCCTDKKKCRELLEKQGYRKPRKSAAAERSEGSDADDQLVSGRRRGAPQRLQRAPAEVIEKERHREQRDYEPDANEPPESVVAADGEDDRYQYFLLSGHRYRTLDKTSGLRHYSTGKGRTWFGGYGGAVVSTKYGAPLAVETFGADDQEWDHYPDLYEAAVAATGVAPLIVSTDKGFGLKDFDEFNTRRGIATARPYRKQKGKPDRSFLRSDIVDEHGVPRCQYCGGEGDMDSPGLGWFLDKTDEPRIRFRCTTPTVSGCRKQQSVACAEEWRLLQPLNQLQLIYHSVRELHFHFEKIFGHWRQRYGVYGKTQATALRRRGVEAQRLRAEAAIFLDWFRICLRHGFLGSWRTRNTKSPEDMTHKGKRRLANVLGKRRRHFLDLPYGAAAERLKLWRAKRSGAPPGVPPEDDLPDGTFTWDDPLEGF